MLGKRPVEPVRTKEQWLVPLAHRADALQHHRRDCAPNVGAIEYAVLDHLDQGHQGNRIEVFYAAPRTVVYEYLAAHLREVLG